MSFALTIALDTVLPIVFTCPPMPLLALVNDETNPGLLEDSVSGEFENMFIGDFIVAQPAEQASVDSPRSNARRN